ncbi:TPR repeat-containing protein [Planktothrix agardhii CCAP 1459/11A]|jgi:tetratricopeptide (TPR) repeat protein|uniref:TPR repeat-containing protein n=1 Tax=Planktothrix agardhii CCAP 1459/11A TaxID=282420 RepID=A0A4V0XUZ0_PLAAG|nr:tetratricopeptide repeat protein [Planktothrix agardhii]GDZ95509.1 TPR repeat-containing protein [Planktothrix agardhii CCAP 1459/11A]
MTPEQKKAEADRLFNQGIEEYYRSQYRQGLQSWQHYQEIRDRQREGVALGSLGNVYNFLGQYQQAIDYYRKNG